MRALIFNLDGTLIDTVYAHVFAVVSARFAAAPPRSHTPRA
jgi:beta-phosphoglucomutase-like phosphatase (HAD superfamily)